MYPYLRLGYHSIVSKTSYSTAFVGSCVIIKEIGVHECVYYKLHICTAPSISEADDGSRAQLSAIALLESSGETILLGMRVFAYT